MKPQRRFSRRKFLATLGCSVVGVAAYSRWMEPTWLGVDQQFIKLAGDGFSSPVKILHLSDLHASGVVPLSFIAKAIRVGIEQQPDLAVLTGDFITGRFEAFDDYASVLQLLSSHVPCFASLGNHDGGRWSAMRKGYDSNESVRNLLARSAITLLHNQSTEFTIRTDRVRLVGLGDIWAREFSPQDAFATVNPQDNSPVLVLSHNPDTKEELRDNRWDVMLCGHTHGGQLRIPIVGTPFAPVRDKRFVKGLHAWAGNRWIYVTKGVGNLMGCRFNCRPEISLLTVS